VGQYGACSNKNTHKHPIPTQDNTPRTWHSTVRAMDRDTTVPYFFLLVTGSVSFEHVLQCSRKFLFAVTNDNG
jgi:hypothetical protein